MPFSMGGVEDSDVLPTGGSLHGVTLSANQSIEALRVAKYFVMAHLCGEQPLGAWNFSLDAHNAPCSDKCRQDLGSALFGMAKSKLSDIRYQIAKRLKEYVLLLEGMDDVDKARDVLDRAVQVLFKYLVPKTERRRSPPTRFVDNVYLMARNMLGVLHVLGTGGNLFNLSVEFATTLNAPQFAQLVAGGSKNALKAEIVEDLFRHVFEAEARQRQQQQQQQPTTHGFPSRISPTPPSGIGDHGSTHDLLPD